MGRGVWWVRWRVLCELGMGMGCWMWRVMGGRMEIRTPRPGVSIPAVTTRFVRTKADILNGRNTASPVSNHM